MENHIATAEDFRRIAEGSRPTARVVLPKLGKAVLLRRPTPMWFLLRGQLPTSLAARVGNGEHGSGEPVIQTADDLAALARWMVPLLQEVFVKPRLSLAPGPDEISPDLLDPDDVKFVIRWAVGEVAPDGSDLASFRGERESAAARASGGNVALPSQ